MPLLCPWRDLSHRALINLSHPPHGLVLFLRRCPFLFEVFQRALLESCIVKPDVIISAILGELVLVLDAALAKYSGFKSGTCAVLLFELGVRSVQGTRF
jgi:hypothetical protein